MKTKWYSFDVAKGYRQKRPPERKPVLLRFAHDDTTGVPEGIAVGYLRYSGGRKDSPFFVTPQFGGFPIAWSDCLGDMEISDLWRPRSEYVNEVKFTPTNGATPINSMTGAAR